MNLEKKQSIFTEPLYLPEFGIDNIMGFCDHVTTICSPDLPLAYTRTHKLAAEMFKDRYVSNIEFLDNDDDYEVFAKVKAQMKKKTVYNVSVTISKTNEVI